MTMLADQAMLAELLERRGLVDAATAAAAAAGGERIAIALVRDGTVEAGTMAGALAEMGGWRMAALPKRLDAGALSPGFLKARMIAPLGVEDGRTVAAMADPTDAEAIAALSFATGLPVAPRVGRVDEIARALGVDNVTPTARPKTAFRSTVVDAGGSARTVTVVAADRAAARRSLHGEGLKPVAVAHGEPSLIQRLRAAWAPGSAAEAELIERIGTARATAPDLNAALAHVAAADLPPAARTAIDRIVARGTSDPVGAIAAEPGLPPDTRALIADARDEGAMLRLIAGLMREREALHVAARAPFVPAAAWAAGGVAMLLASGAIAIAAGAAAIAGIAGVRLTAAVNRALAPADAAAVATITDSSGTGDAARLDREARTLATRLGSYAQAAGIALFVLATILAVRG